MAFWVEYLRGGSISTPCPIETAIARQDTLFKQKYTKGRRCQSDFILFAEHESVYTHVLRKSKRHELFRDKKRGEASLPADLLDVGRSAGSITYHGPGQLTCYLIINLTSTEIAWFQLGSCIDQILIDLLSQYDIEAYPRPEHLPKAVSGVWVTTGGGVWKKIASRGIDVRCGITRFGFALNVSTDLSYFDYIYPCGCDIGMTSMKEILGEDVPSVSGVAKALMPLLEEKFQKK